MERGFKAAEGSSAELFPPEAGSCTMWPEVALKQRKGKFEHVTGNLQFDWLVGVYWNAIALNCTIAIWLYSCPGQSSCRTLLFSSYTSV